MTALFWTVVSAIGFFLFCVVVYTTSKLVSAGWHQGKIDVFNLAAKKGKRNAE